MNNQKQGNRGFTLVEIAIVLVIIGLLLGGVLKGQELINNAKVRAIADRQNSLKVAWFSFIDRFGAIPGDFKQADVYITGAASGNGNGIIRIDHTVHENESVLAFQHLSSAGYLRCPQCTATSPAERTDASNSLINTYSGVMSIWNDSGHYAVRGSAGTERLMIHTGPRIPSNIIAEVDRKIDDGVPNSGDFRFNDFDPINFFRIGGGTEAQEECMKKDSAGTSKGTLYTTNAQYWRPANSSPPVHQDCGASVFI